VRAFRELSDRGVLRIGVNREGPIDRVARALMHSPVSIGIPRNVGWSLKNANAALVFTDE
jgi:hypothetical protein